jgi:transposase
VTRIRDINDVDTLKFAAIQLEKENSRLNERNFALEVEISRLKGLDAESIQQRIAQLEAIVAKQNRTLFGTSSEQRPADSAGDPKENPGSGPQTGHGPREQLGLRVKEEVLDLPEDQRVCKECGGELKPMGDQVEESEEITLIEREPIKVQIKRRKYRCSCNGCVMTAPAPAKLIVGGRCSIAFSVAVAVDKYLFHIPLERQVRMIRQIGLEVDSQTLWDQVWALIRLVRPTYEAIRIEIFREHVIHADETPWFLLDGRRNGGKKKWYLWEVVGHDLAYYEIHDSRGLDAAAHLLTGYDGIVMTDGYEIYRDLAVRLKQGRLDDPDAPGTFQVVNCMAHARRNFVDCESNFPVDCKQILDLIGELYEVERKVPKDLPEAEALALRGRMRDEESRPIVERIRTWLDTTPALPRSGLGQAIQYMKSYWSGLTAFLGDPRLPIDNNHGERSMRGPVVGRKNFYGSKSRRGTEAAAVLYTLAESAKLSGVDPKAYISAVVHRALEEPGAVLLPAEFKRASHAQEAGEATPKRP